MSALYVHKYDNEEFINLNLFFMKNCFYSKELSFSRLVTYFAVLVMASSSLFAADVQGDKVRFIPTVEGDTDTEFLIVTHATDSNFTHNLFHSKGMFLDDAAPVEYTTAGDWVEYQIISPEAGDFAAYIGFASDNVEGEINVSIYKTETEEWSMTGSSVNVYNGSWTNYEESIFPFTIDEPGIYYTMRIYWISGSNFQGIRIEETEGSTNALLSDISLSDSTIDGFSPETYEYTIALQPYVWISDLSAVTMDSTATVEIPEVANPTGVKATAEVVCTSESGITQTYTLNIIKPLEVYEGVTLGLTDADVYYNNGVNMKGSKINNTNNKDYVEYYIFSPYDVNMEVIISCMNGYLDSESYLNVSTLALDDSTWTLQDRYSQHVDITPTIADPTIGAWNSTDGVANEIPFAIQLKGYEPVRLRIYAITNKGNAADIESISFTEIDESINNTLADLTVNGTSLEGFDSTTTSYVLPLPADATEIEIGATPNDATATITSGVGTFPIISNQDTTLEVVVTSEAGYPLTYEVNFKAPKLITAGDTLALGDDVYNYSEGVRASNTHVNYLADSTYVDYYIYSATDADMHITMLAANGNNDTVYSKVNIGTYTLGSEWSPEDHITKDIERVEVGVWSVDYATEEEYNISLVAGEAVMLRLFSITNSYINVANIYKITFGEGHTTAGGEDDTTPISEQVASDIRVVSGTGNLSVIGDETMLGSAVKVYDISGRLVVNSIANSTHETYDVNQRGIYIVRVISPSNEATTAKCIVR